MEILEPGHKYRLPHLESEGSEILTFIKRSSEAVDYGNTEHPGTNSQETIRALIDRSVFLDKIIPYEETKIAINHLREALWWYEARAYRRKIQKVNKTAQKHNMSYPIPVPFTHQNIETYPTGADGHIIF